MKLVLEIPSLFTSALKTMPRMHQPSKYVQCTYVSTYSNINYGENCFISTYKALFDAPIQPFDSNKTKYYLV